MARVIGMVLFVVAVALAGGWRVTAQENVTLAQQVAALKARVGILESNQLPAAIAMHGQEDYCISRPGCTSPLADGSGQFRMICSSAKIWKAPETQPGPAEQQNVLMGCARIFDAP